MKKLTKKLLIIAMIAAGAALSKPAFASIQTKPEPSQMHVWRAEPHNDINHNINNIREYEAYFYIMLMRQDLENRIKKRAFFRY